MITGFEQRVIDVGGPSTAAGWTTLVEESAWWPAIESLGPRVRVFDEGVNAAGKTLRSVEVSYPTASSGIDRRPVILIVAQQHGGEAAGREAIFQLCHEWATTTDPEVIAWLSACCVVCLPTCNPDGLPIPGNPSGSYENGNGVNINRDHYSLSQAESRLIQRKITRYKPVVIIDSHEKGQPLDGTPLVLQMGFRGPTHPAVPPAVAQLSEQLVSELIAAVQQIGVPGYIFGGSTPTMPSLAQQGGQRGAVSVLFESDMFMSHPTREPRSVRVEMQIAAMRCVMRFALRRRAELIGARDSTLNLGAWRMRKPTGAVMDFGNGTKTLVTPTRYFVTTAQRSEWARLWDVLGLLEVPTEGGVHVDVGALYPLLPLMFDARAPEKLISAPHSSPTPAAETGPGLQAKEGGRAVVLVNRAGWDLPRTVKIRSGASWI